MHFALMLAAFGLVCALQFPISLARRHRVITPRQTNNDGGNAGPRYAVFSDVDTSEEMEDSNLLSREGIRDFLLESAEGGGLGSPDEFTVERRGDRRDPLFTPSNRQSGRHFREEQLGRRRHHQAFPRRRQQRVENREMRDGFAASGGLGDLSSKWESLLPDWENPFEQLAPFLHGEISLGPSFGVNWDFSHMLGNRQSNWWEGPNIDAIRSEEDADLDATEIRPAAVYSSSSCHDTGAVYKCTSTVIAQGQKKIFTTVYQCKHGYTRVEGEYGCPRVLNMKDLVETVSNLNLSKLVEAVESVGIAQVLKAGNFTVFAPSDQAFKYFEDKMDMGAVALSSNVVVVRPGSVSMVDSIKDLLAAHLVDGFRASSTLEDEELLDTASPANRIRINTYNVPTKMVTANCARVTSIDNFATNGVVHVIDKVLEPVTKSILDVVSSDPRFTTLKTALAKADMVHTFAADGQFTVFAPTDDAFRQMDQGLLNSLLKNTKCLTKLLQNHVFGNVICSAIIQGRVKSKNLLDTFLNLKEEEGKLFVEDSQIIIRDMVTTNGVIHVIDKVLAPTEAQDIISAAEEAGPTTALELLQRANLTDKLRSSEDITLFLPSNEAFAAVPQDVMAKLDADSELLIEVLTYHAVPETLMDSDLRDGQTLNTLNGGSPIRSKVYTSFPFSHRKTKTVQCAPIITPDLQSCNGVVHIIGKVMLPPSGDLLAVLTSDGRFSTFVRLIKRAGLETDLQAEGPFTLFALTDEAFSVLEPETLRALDSDAELLKKVLQHHVISDTFCCAGAFSPSFYFTARERAWDGSSLSVTQHGSDVIVDGVPIASCDVSATNGVVQVIDRILPSSIQKYVDQTRPQTKEWRSWSMLWEAI